MLQLNLCSVLINRVQKATLVIFNLPSEVFKPSYKREKVPALAQPSRFDPNSKCLTTLLPVLFPLKVQDKGHKGYETKLFQAPEIFQVCR
jgi:hypothetical protein